MKMPGLITADAAILGGGLTGLLLASSLCSEGLRVVVLECHPASCEYGAATLMTPAAYSRMIAIHGADAARQYVSALQSQLHALTAVPLSYVQELPACLYARQEAAQPALLRLYEQLASLHLAVQIASDTGSCPFPVAQSLLMQGQAAVHLSRWQHALRREIRRHGGKLYPVSRRLTLEGRSIHTPHFSVDAPHIILTTEIPLGLQDKHLLALLESRLIAHCDLTSPHPLHSAQFPVLPDEITLLPTPAGAMALWDAGPVGSRTQQSSLIKFIHRLNALLPDYKREEIHFHTAVSTLDGLPIIGRLPASGLLCASGFGTHEVLGAMHAADVLSRRILGKASPADALYAPDRSLPASIRRKAYRRIAGLYAATALRWYVPACAHCRCQMRYSTALQRWECPLCGTCYTILGQPISGPGIRTARVSLRQRPDG